MSAGQLLALWQRGEVVQYNLTLVEGWTFAQVRQALARADKLQQTLDGLSDADLMRRLGAKGEHPEGRFFPDTYRYVRGMRDVDSAQAGAWRAWMKCWPEEVGAACRRPAL